MPSTAYRDLHSTRLAEVKALASLDPSRTKGGQPDPLRTNAVNRGAAVLLAAHLQGFVEDLVVEAIDWFNQSTMMKSDVPAVLMAAHVERHLEDLVAPTELVDRLRRVERLFEEKELYWTECEVRPGKLEAVAVTRHIGNPWPGVIRRAVRLLGGGDPFDDPSIDDARDLERRLKELVGKRNDIAHGSGAPSLTHEQIDKFLEAVDLISRVLDDGTADLIQAVCEMDTRPWS